MSFRKLPPIRVHAATDYVCVTDVIRRLEEGDYLFRNWLSEYMTIAFFRAWEEQHCPHFTPGGYDALLSEAGSNTFVLSPKELLATTNTKGMLPRKTEQAPLYLHPFWATHFGNWLCPKFHVDTIDNYLRFRDEPDFVPPTLIQRLQSLLVARSVS